MGIYKLFATLTKKCPAAFQPVKDLNIYSGKSFAIDIGCMMHAYAYHAKEGDSSYLRNFVSHANNLKNKNIRPVYVFDGAAPEAKFNENQRRRQKQVDLKRKIDTETEALNMAYKQATRIKRAKQEPSTTATTTTENIEESEEPISFISNLFTPSKVLLFDSPKIKLVNDPAIMYNMSEWEIENMLKQKKEQIIQLEKCKRKVKDDHFAQLKILFDENNIEYIQAQGEGEKECVRLCLSGETHIVVSNDGDCLAMGAPILLRNILTQNITEIKMSSILEILGWSLSTFTDYCIMCGSDFNDNIPGLGAETAFKFMHKYKSIENFMNSVDIIKYDSAHMKKYNLPVKDWNYKSAQREFMFDQK